MIKLITAVLLSLSAIEVSAAENLMQDSASFYLAKAKAYHAAKKIWDADKSFQKALSFNPSDENVHLEYGNYLVDQRKFFPAVDHFAFILAKNNNSVVALEKLTEVSFLLRRWSDVLIYGNKLKQKSATANLNFMLGKAYYELENYGQAEKFLAIEVNAHPTSVAAVSLLGKVYIELSNYKHAIAIYNKALNLDPNNNQMIYELGLLYYTINNEKEAVKYFELAVQKGYKQDLDVLENIGLAYLSFDMDKAVKTLDKVLEMKPGNSEILFQVAQAYYNANKFLNAAETYTKIYEADPENVRALYMSWLSIHT